MDLTPDQQQQFENLGLNPIQIPQTKTKANLVPLFSISGLTLISLSGLLLLKNRDSNTTLPASIQNSPSKISNPTPTQVPKSIQHYLLASQQNFSQALSLQASKTSSNEVINYLNESILASTQAIKDFPDDYRGYEQRGRIYQSLIDSQPQFLDAAISDYQQAQKRNSTSAEFTRQLASLYAKKGDLNSTLSYLSATVSLEPTKAQNFYDLAKLQQQAGLLPDALNTYNRLLPLISDATQKSQIETEKSALEKLVAQNPQPKSSPTNYSNSPSPKPNITTDGNLLQASTDSGLIIAAPETSKDITLKNQSESNSLSGTTTLPSGQKQITINNSQLTSTSQIYVTILSGGKNQSLEILSKSTESFTVGFQTPLPEDVSFKWWIVN